MNTILQVPENKLLQNFVSPKLCGELMYMGLSCGEKFHWKVYESDVILNTTVFDIDGYYSSSAKLLDEVTPPKYTVPAFTIKDLEQHLPDFCMCKRNDIYEIMLDEQYGVDSVTSRRLPDAYALIVIAAIKRRVIRTNSENNFSPKKQSA